MAKANGHYLVSMPATIYEDPSGGISAARPRLGRVAAIAESEHRRRHVMIVRTAFKYEQRADARRTMRGPTSQEVTLAWLTACRLYFRRLSAVAYSVASVKTSPLIFSLSLRARDRG